MAEGRGPIKVGTGYVEIVPKILQKDVQELRAKVSTELGKIGVTAAKEVNKAVKEGLAGLPKETAKQAKKAKEAVEAEAVDTAKTLKKIEKQITKEFGEEAAKRFKEYRKVEEKKQKLLAETSSETKKALSQVVRQEEKANAQRKTAAERLERERQKLREASTRAEIVEAEKQAKATLKYNKLIRDAYAENEKRKRQEAAQTAREEERWRRTVSQAYAENEKRNQAAIRETARVQRQLIRENIAQIREQAAAQRATLQDGVAAQTQRMTQLRNQIRDVNRNINSTNRTTQSYFTRTGEGLRKMGTWFDTVGVSINEAANILSTKFLAPLATAGAALTAIGVQSADTRLLGQLGLSAAGVSKSVSTGQMEQIQNYAIDTPFSIDVMHEYQMKMIRSVAGADKSWYSKDASTRTGAANKAAEKTSDLIMAIGDSMARAGNLKPEQFTRAMYAMDMILDMDRAPTKSVKQLAAASGMPASELAQLLGFGSAAKMWKVVGTPAAKGGGVTGSEIMSAMLNYWNPEKYKGTQKDGGSIGSASAMTNETITGRIQQMKERASYELGNLFVKPNKDGQYEYTSLGEKLMGKKVPIYGEDRKGNRTIEGYRTEGGVINQVTDIARKWAPKVDDFLGKFLDGVSHFVSVIDTAADWIDKSGLGELAGPIADFLIKWGPLILAVGLLSKVLGKAVGLVGKLFQPAASVVRGGVRAYEGVRDTSSQRRAARDARSTARSNGASRSDVRQAGRDAYRQQRTTNRNGDDRSTRQRLTDGFMGRDSRQADGQRQVRELEDQMREAREEATRLRDELREVNRETMRQIRDALAGGNGSVQGASNQAQNTVNQIHQNLQQVNGSSLAQIRQELDKVEKAAQDAVTHLGSVKNHLDEIDKKNLNSATTEVGQLKSAAKDTVTELGKVKGHLGTVDGQKLNKVSAEFDDLKRAAEGAGKQVTSDNTRVGNLDKKNVKGVTGSIRSLEEAAKKAADQIGDGARSSSTSGRTANLNKRRLTDIIGEFKKLTSAADKAYDKIGQGTGAKSLAGRVGLLNNRSLKSVRGQVDDLKKALQKAKDEGDGLDGALDRIGKKTPGGGGSSGSRKKGKGNARGGTVTSADVGRYGVVPGYAPWVDNIPAILSPGESVLRPEVTQAIGAERINAWNSMAIRGQISRNARGSGGKFNLQDIKDLQALQNIRPIGEAMVQTMVLDSTSDPLGGSTQGGILRTGDHSARVGGSVTAGRMRGMYDWITSDVYDLLKKVPTGVGQLAGILGGTLSPIVGEYFWDDVWQGHGNIVDRGKRYFNDMWSMKTLEKVWDNLYSGTADSLGALWNTVTNPFDSITTAFTDVYDVVTGSYNNLIGMVSTVKDVIDSPKAYATRVGNAYLDNAKESMPNLDGLFDFSDGAKVSNNSSDAVKKLFEGYTGPIKGVGGAKKWKNVAMQAMTMNGMPASALPTVLHRINVESGGNPLAVNKWDSNWKAGHPSVGLMQVIGPTFGAYAGPFRGTQPQMYGVSTAPLANIYAGLNYAKHRYGSRWQSVLSGTTGYATGTLSASPGLAMVGEKGRELVAFGGGERVFNNEETEGILNGKKYEIHVHEARTEPTPQAVLRALRTAEALYTNL
ncbi:hypothetical protein ACIRLA_28805 [Streptomyces sp. NPDC102364]|uniref:hypothetical protein n=1 Tax=Streptomyces sp. NPDC102364 TaxID=3366161 RepID=UPI00381EB214